MTTNVLNVKMLDLGENQDKDKPSVHAVIKTNAQGIEIQVDGYGTREEADGHGTPIFIEFYEGHLRVVVWNDINQSDPQIIDMEPARLSNRKEEV